MSLIAIGGKITPFESRTSERSYFARLVKPDRKNEGLRAGNGNTQENSMTRLVTKTHRETCQVLFAHSNSQLVLYKVIRERGKKKSNEVYTT